MIRTILIALLMASLVGCATPVPPRPADIPANLLVPCDDIPHIDKPTTLGVALKYIKDFQTQYATCATRNDDLREAAKKP